VQKIYAEYMPGSSERAEYSKEDARKLVDISKQYGFVDILYKLYRRTRTFTAKEYTALLGTYSDHIAIKEHKRAEFFDRI